MQRLRFWIIPHSVEIFFNFSSDYNDTSILQIVVLSFFYRVQQPRDSRLKKYTIIPELIKPFSQISKVFVKVSLFLKET